MGESSHRLLVCDRQNQPYALNVINTLPRKRSFLLKHRFVSLVCRARIDLGLLIDGTNSRYRFNRILKVVYQFIRYFDISRLYTRVGIITYSTSPIPFFDFKRLTRKYDVLRAVRKISFPRGRSYTGRALRFAGRYLYPGTRRTFARSKVLVVFTGYRSYDSVRRPAQMLRRAGVEIFAVGMAGRRSVRYLSSMGHDRYHVYNAGSRAALRPVVERLVAKICAATPIGKPTPTSKFNLFYCCCCFCVV